MEYEIEFKPEYRLRVGDGRNRALRRNAAFMRQRTRAI
jgi:hypothetical protein